MNESQEIGFLDYLNLMSLAVSIMSMKYGASAEEVSDIAHSENERQPRDIIARMESRMKKQKEIMEELSNKMDDLLDMMKGEKYGL